MSSNTTIKMLSKRSYGQMEKLPVMGWLIIGLGYYLLAQLGLAFSPPQAFLSPVWPASGLALAALIYNRYLWPGIVIAGLAVYLPLVYQADLSHSARLLIAGGLTTAMTLEPILGRYLIKRWATPGRLLSSTKEMTKFAFSMITAAAFSASLITWACYWAGMITPPAYTSWANQFFAALTSMCLLTPLLLAWRRHKKSKPWQQSKVIEFVILLALFAFVVPISTRLWDIDGMPLQLPSLLLPALLWSAYRFELRLTLFLIFVAGAFSYAAALYGSSNVLAEARALPLLATQILLCLISLSVLSVAVNVVAGRRTQRDLRNINQQLEERVLERTNQLLKSNRELQDYRKHLEDRVAERTSDLELANQEIESFSYSVSHDLRSPLRAIDGYSHALLEEYGDQLDERANNYLQRSRTASQRMGILIDDVLLLSRVTRHQLEINPIDLTALAHEIVEEIKAANQSVRIVSFNIHENLYIQGDASLLRIVLENLFGNAWKYTAGCEHANIEFGQLPSNHNEHVFFIKDNGIGFDMRYVEKLFGVFQRLHSNEEFEGTGIGLATVSRIIQRHSGKVWAQAEPNKGATFFISFPQRGRTTGPRKSLNFTDM